METADYAEFVDFFNPKAEDKSKPQIPQISRMGEVKELGSNRRQNSSAKKVDGGDPLPSFFSNL
jgi:hypothetical protein